MHALGLIHNDLNPSNIMINGDSPVTIDFDSCKREGEKLGLKLGTFGWAMEGVDYATPQNDYFGLSKIREALVEEEERGHE